MQGNTQIAALVIREEYKGCSIAQGYLRMMEIRRKLKSIKPLYRVVHNIRSKAGRKAEEQKKESYRRYGKQILKDICTLVNDDLIKCLPAEGTLLGLIRDGHLIPWDDDLDFSIIFYDGFSWKEFEKKMKKAGFWKFREIEQNGNVIAESYKKNGVLCDFGIETISEKNRVMHYGCYEFPGNVYKNGKNGRYRVWDLVVPSIAGIEEGEIDGIHLWLPTNAKDILKATYGESWCIPDSNYKSDHEEHEIEYKFTYYKKPLFKH